MSFDQSLLSLAIVEKDSTDHVLMTWFVDIN